MTFERVRTISYVSGAYLPYINQKGIIKQCNLKWVYAIIEVCCFLTVHRK